MSDKMPMSEKDFNHLTAAVYERIESQFDQVDPDQVECEISQGSLVITLESGAKWILSRQPPVRQLWLAVASRGRAYHFDYMPDQDQWRDSKGEAPDLLKFLSDLLKEDTGLMLNF